MCVYVGIRVIRRIVIVVVGKIFEEVFYEVNRCSGRWVGR